MMQKRDTDWRLRLKIIIRGEVVCLVNLLVGAC